MQKRDLISVIIIVIVILILLTGIVYFNFIEDDENNRDNNKKMVFKDISFIDTISSNLINIYDTKYVIVDNILYDLDGNILFDGSSYNDIDYVLAKIINMV